MKQKLIRFASYSALTSLLGGLIVGGVAYAQAPTPAPILLEGMQSAGTSLFCPIIDWMFWVLMAVAVIMVIWAAYLYLTAGEDTEQVHKATKILTYAAVAVVVALIAKGFPLLIESIFPAAYVGSPIGCP